MNINPSIITDLWTSSDIIEFLYEFLPIYENRPIKNNQGGMNSSHLYAICFIINKLKPKFIIESGVWFGLGTWFFEQFSPSSTIISIDINLHNRKYISSNVIYLSKDFYSINWNDYIPISERINTLLFFDDHQNALSRIYQSLEFGFKHIVFEDNYPTQHGDCYSLKKIFMNNDYFIKNNIFKKNDNDLLFLNSSIHSYIEMPPIFKPSLTRWNTPWNDLYPTKNPIFSEPSFEFNTFFNEATGYTWICYVFLH